MSQPPQPPYSADRTFAIVLSVVVAFVVLCVGGASASAFVILRGQDGRLSAADAPAGPAAVPAPPPASPSASPSAPAVRIVEPTTLGGRPKLYDGDLQATADMLKDRVTGPTDTHSVSAVYGKPGTKNVVLMAAAAGPNALLFQAVAGTLSTFGSSTVGVSGGVNPPTGSLGGNATCANTVVAGQKAAVCVWADEGSLGLVVFPGKVAAAVAAEFPKLRAQIEKTA
jgi:hypothetical protein